MTNHLTRLTALLVLSLFPGCASVPKFTPSQEIAAVGSLPEALLLCSEYRIPADADRPVALRPFLDCLKEAKAAYPGARLSGFEGFLAEFQVHYDGLQEWDWNPRLGAEIQTAVHASLRALWREVKPQTAHLPERTSKEERRAVLTHFPRFAQAMGVDRWAVADDLGWDTRLERLRAGLSAFYARGGTAPEHCRRLEQFDRDVGYLDSLWRDRREVLLLGLRHGATLERVDTLYFTRLGRLETELRQLKQLPGGGTGIGTCPVVAQARR